MEKKLKSLFEFQRFEKNSQLEALIADTHARSAQALSDDALDFVNAAGDVDTMSAEEKDDFTK